MLSLLATTLTVMSPAAAPPTAALLDVPTNGSASERGAQDHASLHPSKPTLYLAVPDITGLVEGYASSAYGRALANPEFHKAIEGLLGEDVQDGSLPLAAWMDALAAGDDEMTEAFALIAGLESASISIGMPDLPPMELVMSFDLMTSEESVRKMGIQIMLDYESADLAASAFESMWFLMGGEGGSLVPVEDSALPAGMGAVSMMRGISDEPFEASLRLIQMGNRVTVIGGNNTLEGLAARIHDKPSPDPLATGRAQFGPTRGTTALEFHNGLDDTLLHLLVNEIGPVALPIADLIEGMAGPLMTMIVRGGDWRIQLDGGRFITDGMHSVPTNTFSPIFASAPLPQGALDAVPSDASLAWVAHFDADAAQAWIVDAMSGGQSEGMDRIQAKYGFRLDRDLIAPLGDSISWSMGSSISVLSAPPLLGSIPLKDPETFRLGLEKFMAAIGQAGEGAFEISERAYRKQPIYTLRFPNEDSGPTGFGINVMGVLSPSIVALDDRVIITLNSSNARRAVRAALSGAGSDGPHAALHGLELSEDATEVAYADWMGILGQTYDGVRASILPMLAGNLGDDLPVDLSELPDSEQFTGFWNPSYRWKRTMEHGTVHHAESSFGPEGLLLPGALVFLFLGVSESSGAPVPVAQDY